MSKYIDADLFKSELEKGHDNGDITGRADVEKLLDEQPTADVHEVRRGKWVNRKGNFRQCSICGTYNNRISKFCSECGAKMEVEQE